MDAAASQQELDNLAKDLAKKYDTITFDIRERRDFKGAPGRPVRRPQQADVLCV